MEEFINILQNDPDKAFDWLCNNGWKLSKDELVSIGKELLYAVWAASRNGTILHQDHDYILGVAADYLKEDEE